MPLQLITAPTAEPLTLADAKAWARIDTNADDNLVKALIKAARSFAETKLRRSLITQTWQLTLDSFPGPSQFGVPYGETYSLPGHAIILERPPVQSIVSIQYTAMDGTTQTMPITDYVDLTGSGTQRVDDLTRITPVFGKIWPINLPQIGSVRVKYVTGFGDDATNIPEDILTWVKLRVGTLYENREEVVVGTRITVSELPYIDSLIDPYVVELL
jgi:uncharacterized phiE125 gp8 family phage protein